MQPLRHLGTPLADISQPMPFTAVQTAFDRSSRWGSSRATGKRRTSRVYPTRRSTSSPRARSAAVAAHARRDVPDGRRDHGWAHRDGLRRTFGAVDVVDRWQLGEPGRQRGQHRLGARELPADQPCTRQGRRTRISPGRPTRPPARWRPTPTARTWRGSGYQGAVRSAQLLPAEREHRAGGSRGVMSARGRGAQSAWFHPGTDVPRAPRRPCRSPSSRARATVPYVSRLSTASAGPWLPLRSSMRAPT